VSFAARLLLTCLCGSLAIAAQSESVAVAYSSGGVLYLATGAGKILNTIHPKIPIGNFAISPDARTVVFTRSDAKPNGGRLYRLDVATSKVTSLTSGPHYIRGEVYADPDFSPDGRQIVFAIHSRAEGDRIDAAGPSATMDLATRKVNILMSTRMWGGIEPEYANHPHWSPDGTQLLLNVTGTFALADAAGRHKEELARMTESGPTDLRATFALGWIGNSCVAYVYYTGRDPQELDRAPLQILNLRTREKQPAQAILGATLPGAIDIAWPLRVRHDGDTVLVEGPTRSWKIPVQASRSGSGNDPFVRLVPRQHPEAVPPACH
jgi:hypothetical protein